MSTIRVNRSVVKSWRVSCTFFNPGDIRIFIFLSWDNFVEKLEANLSLRLLSVQISNSTGGNYCILFITCYAFAPRLCSSDI